MRDACRVRVCSRRPHSICSDATQPGRAQKNEGCDRLVIAAFRANTRSAERIGIEGARRRSRRGERERRLGAFDVRPPLLRISCRSPPSPKLSENRRARSLGATPPGGGHLPSLDQGILSSSFGVSIRWMPPGYHEACAPRSSCRPCRSCCSFSCSRRRAVRRPKPAPRSPRRAPRRQVDTPAAVTASPR